MRLDLVSLDLFLSVADEGSIAQAAERRNIAPSAVSRRLQELELLLDAPLIQRHARGVKLTAAGEALQRHARSVFGVLSRMHDELAEHAKGVRGHVRIATNPSALIEFLPEQLMRFTTSYPGVRIELLELVSPEIVQSVRDGMSDIGILAASVAAEGLETLPYREDRLQAVMPADHRLAEARALHFHELLAYPQVGLKEGSSIQAILLKAAAEAGEAIDLRVRVSSFDALRRLVQAGLGIGVLPEACIRPYEGSMRLKGVRLLDPWARRVLKVCVREIATLPVPARFFLSQVAAGVDSSKSG